MLYPVNEIFSSLQGEGVFTGKSSIFIRFAGCNLDCPWCDTNHTQKRNLSISDLKNNVLSLASGKSQHVVFTGGEPTLHDLARISKELRPWFDRLCVESNGTNLTALEGLRKYVHWCTISPKKETPLEAATFADEIKIVLTEEQNPLEWLNTPHGLSLSRLGRLFIQPKSEDYKPALEFVVKHPEFRLSVQLHKILSIR